MTFRFPESISRTIWPSAFQKAYPGLYDLPLSRKHIQDYMTFRFPGSISRTIRPSAFQKACLGLYGLPYSRKHFQPIWPFMYRTIWRARKHVLDHAYTRIAINYYRYHIIFNLVTGLDFYKMHCIIFSQNYCVWFIFRQFYGFCLLGTLMPIHAKTHA